MIKFIFKQVLFIKFLCPYKENRNSLSYYIVKLAYEKNSNYHDFTEVQNKIYIDGFLSNNVENPSNAGASTSKTLARTEMLSNKRTPNCQYYLILAT